LTLAEKRVRFNEHGVAMGKEEGDPEELLEDPTFEARLHKRLVEIGRRFGIERRLAARRAAATGGQASPEVTRRG
jgi:hypothetical protein